MIPTFNSEGVNLHLLCRCTIQIAHVVRAACNMTVYAAWISEYALWVIADICIPTLFSICIHFLSTQDCNIWKGSFIFATHHWFFSAHSSNNDFSLFTLWDGENRQKKSAEMHCMDDSGFIKSFKKKGCIYASFCHAVHFHSNIVLLQPSCWLENSFRLVKLYLFDTFCWAFW